MSLYDRGTEGGTEGGRNERSNYAKRTSSSWSIYWGEEEEEEEGVKRSRRPRSPERITTQQFFRFGGRRRLQFRSRESSTRCTIQRRLCCLFIANPLTPRQPLLLLFPSPSVRPVPSPHPCGVASGPPFFLFFFQSERERERERETGGHLPFPSPRVVSPFH